MNDTRAPAIDIALVGDAVAREPATAASTAGRTNIFDFDRVALERFFEEELGEKKFRAQQVMKWIHHRYVTDFGDMTDLGKALRAKLEEHAVVHAPQLIFDKESTDGTHKWLLGMDPKKADKGTIRADFADSIDANAVHGSDAAETAAQEIAFFFPGMQICAR